MHEEINPFEILSGKVVKNEHGIYWFKEPGYNIDINGTIIGKLHRVGGPAIEYKNNSEWWFQNGKKHRVGGPAFRYKNGYEEWQEWWEDGKRHRKDGPALILTDGEELWYTHGTKSPKWIILLKKYLRKIKLIKK